MYSIWSGHKSHEELVMELSDIDGYKQSDTCRKCLIPINGIAVT